MSKAPEDDSQTSREGFRKSPARVLSAAEASFDGKSRGQRNRHDQDPSNSSRASVRAVRSVPCPLYCRSRGILVPLFLLLAMACSSEPEPGQKIATFVAKDDGEQTARSELFLGRDDSRVTIEKAEVLDEKGSAVFAVTSVLHEDDKVRFTSRYRFMGSVEEADLELLPSVIRWRKRKGLAISRATVEVEDPVLLDWHIGFGPVGSVALWHRFAPRLMNMLAKEEQAEHTLPVFSFSRGQLWDLFVSHRETRKANVGGVEKTSHRFFVSTHASGHTVWIDGDDGSLLSVDNVFGLRVFGETMVREDFSLPERDIEPLPCFLNEEHLTIRNDDVELAGTLTFPVEEEKPFPLVLLIHGSGAVDRDESPFMVFRHLAHDLGEAGFAVFRYDKRGVAESRFLGEERTITLETLASDVKAWLDVMVTRPEIDSKRITLAGHSEGGYIGPFVASRDTRVANVVMLAGAVDPLLQIVREQAFLVGEAHGLTQAELDRLIGSQSVLLRRIESDVDFADEEQSEQLEWFRSHVRYDQEATLRALDVPLLAIFADGDIQVPIGQADRMATLAEKKPDGMIEIEVLDGLDHVLMDNRGGRDGLGLLNDPDRRLDPRIPRLMAEWLDR